MNKIVEFMKRPISKRTFLMTMGIYMVIFFGAIDYICVSRHEDIRILLFPEELMLLYVIFMYIMTPNTRKKNKNEL